MADETKVPELPLERSPMLQMDGIRIATLCVLAVDTLVVVLLAVFLVTNVQGQRQVNECYQDMLDDTLAWAHAAVVAGKQDRQAIREFLLSRLSTPESDGREATERYLAQLDEADRTRGTAPPPAQRCAR